MKISTIVCDIDGTLLPPDQGTLVDERVASAMIALQEEGFHMILASARIFQGVLPLAKQIRMDHFGGSIISSNGAYAYDVVKQKEWFLHGIAACDALIFQEQFTSQGLDFAIAQQEHMVATGFSKGFELDHFNCDVDYVITHHPKQYLHTGISKCSASGEPGLIDAIFPILQARIEQAYPYHVIRSTPYFVDIIAADCGKANALKELAGITGIGLDQMAAIGDGNSDAEMIAQCHIGATLQNGTDACKQVADLIVPSCEEFGCLKFFDYIKGLK